MAERVWDKRLLSLTIGREDKADPNWPPYGPEPYSVPERLDNSGHIR